MKPQILTTDDIEHFIERGYVLLHGAFAADDALLCRDFLWKHIAPQGIERDDRATWRQSLVQLKETFGARPGEEMFARCWTPRLQGALDDVMGRDRYNLPRTLGWWPIVFPGHFATPWQPPTLGWHVDGIQFHHHIDSPDQGLLPLFILSEIAPGDGGTAIWEGSHRVAARVLQDAQPHGLDIGELTRRVMQNVESEAGSPSSCVREVIGQPGDVALLHPFMLHARSDCVAERDSGRVRFICNPCITLREPMNFAAATRELSPVEEAIAQSLADVT